MQSIALKGANNVFELPAVYHRPTDNFAYPIDQHTLHIRLKTKKNDVTSVALLHGDQYEWSENHWVYHQDTMSKNGSDYFFDYWLISVTPPFKRLRYGFILYKDNEQMVYTEKGFFQDPPQDPGYYFCFPYLHATEVFRSPDWVKNTIWYQIFPERFANGDDSINPEKTLAWDSEPPSPTNFFGGDFQGIMDHLDYLVELGITGIYFTPIFKAYSNHKYDTMDYFEIDPQFGDKATFKKLVDQCHENGIKVMLDAVFNHSGLHFAPFKDVLRKGKASEYADWFYATEFPLQGGDRPNYSTFGFVETMPKLNTQNPKVKSYLLEVGRYWVKEFNIDGWRLDVANEIDHQFWRDFRTAVKEIKPDIYILGEVWHDAMPWLRGDQFDAVMNYPFSTNVINFFGKGYMNSKQFIENMTHVIQQYPLTVNGTNFNLVGSHDTPRIINQCNHHKEKVKLIYTFMLTFIGTPCIYYGDELGLTGEMDPDCRKCMPWNHTKEQLELMSYFKKLIEIRKKEPLLANDGTFMFLESTEENPCVAFTKFNTEKRALVILNPSDQKTKYSLPYPLKSRKIVNMLNEKEYALEAEQLCIMLKPYDAAILVFPN
ncbi:alpha-glycosidase [Bacillus sp. 03113]|uniref:alpha-glycosidase n=1 Tax=Bacillus sp. 03113 TaxID=2578211 RepID=UPI0011429DE8|nr:alpha-glycosidase [Bacillus sp. 03113]